MKKKSHNQKIRDAHVARTQEKQAAKQVLHFIREENCLFRYFI